MIATISLIRNNYGAHISYKEGSISVDISNQEDLNTFLNEQSYSENEIILKEIVKVILLSDPELVNEFNDRVYNYTPSSVGEG